MPSLLSKHRWHCRLAASCEHMYVCYIAHLRFTREASSVLLIVNLVYSLK